MKYLVILFSSLLVVLTSCQVKTASDSQEKVAPDSIAVEADSCYDSTTSATSAWKIEYFVDEFGEKTNDAFLCHYANGEFSNSATTNSRLNVLIIVTKNGIRFDTYEYGNHLMKGEGRLEYRAKLPNDSIVYFHTWNDDEGFNSVSEADVNNVIKLFKQYNDIKFAARTQKSYSVSTYRFTYSGNSNLFSKDYDALAE